MSREAWWTPEPDRGSLGEEQKGACSCLVLEPRSSVSRPFKSFVYVVYLTMISQ
jgi:hypothetical protein